MEKSYSTLGKWFEYLNDDCDYRVWAQYLISKLKNLGAGPVGIDMGCGNGYFTRALEKEGYSMTGMDVSSEMLTVASQKSAESGGRAQYFLGDMTTFSIKPKVDFCVAINDVLNYVPPQKLAKTFKNVFSGLKTGGVFLFDVSSEHKLRDVLGSNAFCEDRDDISYMWFNSFDEGAVTMDLTFFIRQPDGTYTRREERHVQYAHSETDIMQALTDVGFSSVTSEGHLGKDKSERINFAATKRA